MERALPHLCCHGRQHGRQPLEAVDDGRAWGKATAELSSGVMERVRVQFGRAPDTFSSRKQHAALPGPAWLHAPGAV